jgi:hypothetical protein
LQLVEASPLAVHVVFDATHSARQFECARELLFPRRRALAESLDESLRQADDLFGFEQVEIDCWWSLIERRSGGNDDKLELPIKTESSSRAQERLTCTNEWLLREMYSVTHLAE